MAFFEGIGKWFADLGNLFYKDFIKDASWKLLLQGLGNTMLISLFAVLIGLFLGVVIAIVRSTYDKNREVWALQKGVKYYVFMILNALCRVYVTVIRGVPVVVQLVLMYLIILVNVPSALLVAIIAFGINSGAYVAEIVRGGIMSMDQGQFEAGRSLGFNYVQTMVYIIIPQVFKSVLPTLCSEFIVLIKETSIAGYIGIMDLNKAGEAIRNSCYDIFLPLIFVALIYLGIVTLLTWLVGKLERSLRKNER